MAKHRRSRPPRPLRPPVALFAAFAALVSAPAAGGVGPLSLGPAHPVVVPAAVTVRPVAVVAPPPPRRVPPLTGRQGLLPAATALAARLQADYPGIREIGGVRPCDTFMEHCRGIALDVMVSPALGDEIAAALLTDPSVAFIIWRQTIRYHSGASRRMLDRGSATANHYDHIHVRVRA